MRPAFTVLLILLTAGGLAVRLPQLDRRPMHTDEAVHAVKFLGLWERGEYRYDPHEYHGPSLYYATLPLAWASRARDRTELSEQTLRLTTVLCGSLLVLALGLVRDGLGRGATLAAAALTAGSPAMVFYSRYFIHELPLVLFSFLFLAAAWRYTRRAHLGWALLAGVALGLMHATKETFVFVLVAAAAGLAAVRLTGPRSAEESPARCLRWSHLGLALVAAAGVSFLLFTSFLTNLRGPLDSILTYRSWFERAEGNSPHVHPWYYYFQLLLFFRQGQGPVWSEGLILGLGLFGMVCAFTLRAQPGADPVWIRFLAVYTVLLTAIYSLIPYKTPWCLLGFLHGWILLAGCGAAALLGILRPPWLRGAGAVALLLAFAQLGGQAWRASWPYAESQRNPYVYAQTSSSLLELVDKVREIAQTNASGRDTVIQVMARGGDYWPLPWYLRGFRAVGWWAAVPEDAAAPILIASPAFAPGLASQLGERDQALGYFGLRPAVFLQLHVETTLWERFLQGRRGAPPD